jgi:glycine/D-amino acid oxidase-like deaminating enzyme
MSEQNSFDVAVIGAGVVGCTTARSLALRGMRVAVVEADAVGRGTSANTFAWINATSKTTDEDYHRLNAMGAEGYRDLAREWGERRIGLHPTGMLEWSSPADSARLEDMRAAAAQLERWGYPVAWVGRDSLRAMEPHVRFEDGAQGLFAMADAWLDVPRFLHFLVDRLRADGARILERCRARQLLMDDEGSVLGLDTDAGRLDTKQVVVAAGPDTAEVLSSLTGYDGFAARFPLRRAPGLLITAPGDASRQLTRHILYTSHSSHAHVRETADGGLLIAADDADGRILEDGSDESVKRAAFDILERVRRRLQPRHWRATGSHRRHDHRRPDALRHGPAPRGHPQRRHAGPGDRLSHRRFHRVRQPGTAPRALRAGPLSDHRLTPHLPLPRFAVIQSPSRTRGHGHTRSLQPF